MKCIYLSLKIAVGFLVILLFANFSKKHIYYCNQQNSPIEINKFQDLWEGEYYYNLETAMHYGITHDDHNLYVAMKTSDKILKQKIIMGGLTFWIDTNARGKEQLGLTFPFPQKLSHNMMKRKNPNLENNQNNQKKTNAEIRDFNNRYLNGLELMDIIGFDGQTELSTYKNINKKGISTVLHIDSTEFMYYFASIPLNMIFDNPLNYLNNTENQFSFSFKTNEIQMPSNNMGGGNNSREGMSGGGGRPGGHGGGGHGGGRGGGTGVERPDNTQIREMMQSTVLTIKKAALLQAN